MLTRGLPHFLRHIAVLLLLGATTTAGATVGSTGNYVFNDPDDGFVTFASATYQTTLTWVTDSAFTHANFTIDAQGTGWVAIGFTSSTANLMAPADVVLGYVDDVTGQAYVGDYWNTEGVPPTAYATNNAKLISGSQVGGRTTISFMRPFVGDQTSDTVHNVALTSVVNILFAYHATADNYLTSGGHNVNHIEAVTFGPTAPASQGNVGGSTTTASPSTSPNPTDQFLLQTPSISVSRTMVKTTPAYVTFTVTATTAGWVGIGFNVVGQMSGASIVIASADGRVMNGHNTGEVAPTLTDTQYVKIISTQSAGGTLTVVFSRPVDAQNANDYSLATANFLVWSINPTSTDFTSRHATQGVVKVNFLSGQVTPVNTAVVTLVEYLPVFVLLVVAIVSLVIRQVFGWGHIFSKYVLSSSLDMTAGTLLFWIIWIVTWVVYYLLSVSLQVEPITVTAGRAVMMMVAFTLFPIGRTSLLVRIFNLPFERAVMFHVLFGGFIFIAIVIHLALVIKSFAVSILTQSNGVGTTDGVVPIFGLLAAIFFVVMAVAASMRRFNWEYFYYVHKTLALLFIVAVALHATNAVFLLVIPVLVYLIDLGFRFYQGNQLADLVAIEARSDITSISLKNNRSVFRNFEAGSYAFLSIPSAGFGWHPFSIASPPAADVLTFHIKNMGPGTFTGKLHAVASKCSESGREMTESGVLVADNVKKAVPVYIFGPYGALNVNLMKSQCIAMFAGGIGITPFLSIFQDLALQKSKGSMPELKMVFLFWITRGNEGIAANLEKIQNTQSEFQFVCFNTEKAKRPEVASIFQEYLVKSVSENVTVLACGPAPMVKEVQAEAFKRKYEFHKETFLL